MSTTSNASTSRAQVVGYVPTVHDFTSVVHSCVQRGAWEAAIAVVEHMKRKQLQPTVFAGPAANAIWTQLKTGEMSAKIVPADAYGSKTLVLSPFWCPNSVWRRFSPRLQ